MSKHKTTSTNLLEKIDANNVMVNKWTVLGVGANAIIVNYVVNLYLKISSWEQVN